MYSAAVRSLSLYGGVDMTPPTEQLRLLVQVSEQAAQAVPVAVLYPTCQEAILPLLWLPGFRIFQATWSAISRILPAGSPRKQTLFPSPPVPAEEAGAAAAEEAPAPVRVPVQDAPAPVRVVDANNHVYQDISGKAAGFTGSNAC